MPIRPGLNGEADETTRLLNTDEEQGDSHAYRAADQGTFQLHGKDGSDNSSNGKYDKHQHDTHHVKFPAPPPSPSQRDQKRTRGDRGGAGLWKIAAHEADRAQHRREISEKLRTIDGSVFTECHMADEKLTDIKNKKVKQFYRDQNARISAWFEVDAVVKALAEEILQSFEPQDLDQDGIAEAGGELQVNREQITEMLPAKEREKRQQDARRARIAINVNVAANVLLVAAKAIATIFSSSLSLLASLADSVLDLLMTIIIFSTTKLVAWRSTKLSRMYPVGRRRLQPLGTLVFSVIMVVSFLQILQEAVMQLWRGIHDHHHKLATLPPAAIGSMAGTIGLKGLIWFGCAWQQSSQVQALAQDCKTDVIFNVASLLFPAIGIWTKAWWLDPLGAGLLSIYIIFDWAHTCLNHVNHLSGAHVDDATLRKLMFLAWRFSPVVNAYKNLQAYHAGDGVWVEVDILLDPKVNLKHAHDLAELMQYCFEGLEVVDRAFVTVDYAEQGPSGHAQADSIA
ncbi:hypothetical protein P389DRAFT_170303 [Cystobasidium minutum MCA 4210]|uniref:uncharacterized protein n=1 Tax=Cystobasidium minutum MCA 4210 TaxID=1397322 RepID=UPI0034CF6033|eukprot:jgi/Rhomi1/170303/fgenesh1_kg.4_\